MARRFAARGRSNRGRAGGFRGRTRRSYSRQRTVASRRGVRGRASRTRDVRIVVQTAPQNPVLATPIGKMLATAKPRQSRMG